MQLFDKSRQNQHRQTVNNMVSFNAIKNFVIELFYRCSAVDKLMKTLISWFVTGPTCRKLLREVIREGSCARVSLNYYKRVFRPCF